MTHRREPVVVHDFNVGEDEVHPMEAYSDPNQQDLRWKR